MTPLPHGLLALPAPGDARLRAALDRCSAIAMRALLTTRVAGAHAEGFAAIQWALVRLGKRDAAALAALVGSPDVLPVALSVASSAVPAETLASAAPVLIDGLAKHGERLPWHAPLVAGEAYPLREGLELALHDANPLAMREAHPDKAGNAVDLGGHSVDAWLGALRDALAAIDVALPEWAAELPVALRRIVPVGYDAEKHLSASYREAPRLVYLTLHPDLLTLAEALVHEVQHGKLNALLWSDEVLTNAYTTWTESPVRPDLRPVMGVLLAAHAFVPVAALHLRLAEGGHAIAGTARFAERRKHVLAGNARALAIVHDKGTPTPVGRQLLDALDALHAAVLAATPEALRPAPATDALPPG